MTDAISLLRRSASNAGSQLEYPIATCTDAITALLDDFIVRSRTNRQSFTLNINANLDSSTSIDPEDLPASFRKSRLLPNAYIPTGFIRDPDVKIIGYQEMLRLTLRDAPQNATPDVTQPKYLSFDSDVSGRVWPTPDQAWAIVCEWLQPCILDGSNNLPIPDDLSRQAIMLGGASFLQNKDPEKRYAQFVKSGYLEYCTQVRGETSLVGPTIEIGGREHGDGCGHGPWPSFLSDL